MGSSSDRMFSAIEEVVETELLDMLGCSNKRVVELGNGIQEIPSWFQDLELSWFHETAEGTPTRVERQIQFQRLHNIIHPREQRFSHFQEEGLVLHDPR